MMRDKLLEFLCSLESFVDEALAKTMAAAKEIFDSFDSWYAKQEDSIQELTSIVLALLIALMLRIIIVHM